MQKISVVIPTFNADQYIGAAIESVLAQSAAIHEICVVDDGSTDNTQSILKTFEGRIRSCRQTNQGPSAARNRALEEVTGDLIIFLDADDILDKNAALALASGYERGVQEGKKVGVVYGDYWLVESELRYKRRVSVGRISRSQLIVDPCLIPSGMLASLKCVESAGRFDPTLDVCEDWDYCLRIAYAGFEFYKVSAITCIHREHGGSLSKNEEHAITGRLKLLHRWRCDARTLEAERTRIRKEVARTLLRRVRQQIYDHERASAQVSLEAALGEDPSLFSDPLLVSYCTVYVAPFFRETISLADVEAAVTCASNLVMEARQKLGRTRYELGAGSRIALCIEFCLRRHFVSGALQALVVGVFHPDIVFKMLRVLCYEWTRTKAMRSM